MNVAVTFLISFAVVVVVVAIHGGDGGGESRRRRSDDPLSGDVAAMVQTLAQRVTVLEAESQAYKLQLDKCASTAFFTAHVGHQTTPAHGETVLFDVIQADSDHAYDVTQRAYVIPITGIYWVSVIADVTYDGARAVLELFIDSELLGSADAADVSEAVYSAAFRFNQGQKLLVRRGHDGYTSGNPLQSRTSLSVVLVQAL